MVQDSVAWCVKTMKVLLFRQVMCCYVVAFCCAEKEALGDFVFLFA